MLQFVYLAAAVAIVAITALVGFAILFNGATILAWMFVAGAVAFRQGFIEYRNRLLVSGTATAKASSAAIGLAELTGRGRAPHPGAAPVSGTPCLFWKVEIHQWQRRSKHHGWRRKLRRMYQAVTFELEDESGRMLVWTRGAEVIPVTRVWRSDEGDPPEAGLRLVASLGLHWPPPSSGYPMKITEQRIEEGGPLYVMGTLTERKQIPPSPPRFLPALLDRWARTSPALEGGSFAAALRFVRDGAQRLIARDLQAAAPLWLPPDIDGSRVVVWKGDGRRPFIIAGVLEREALTALSRRTWASILAGAALMAAALFVTLSKLTHLSR